MCRVAEFQLRKEQKTGWDAWIAAMCQNSILCANRKHNEYNFLIYEFVNMRNVIKCFRFGIVCRPKKIFNDQHFQKGIERSLHFQFRVRISWNKENLINFSQNETHNRFSFLAFFRGRFQLFSLQQWIN